MLAPLALYSLFLPAVEGICENLRFSVHAGPRFLEVPGTLMIRLFVKPLIALRVFRRSMLVKAAGKIRLLHEVKTGDPRFDAEFAVFARDAVSARSYLQQTAVRQGLRALLEYGIWKAGAVFCPINYNFKGRLLSYRINDTKPRLMIAEQSLIPLLNVSRETSGKRTSSSMRLPETSTTTAPMPPS
jgi:hypothetical protein